MEILWGKRRNLRWEETGELRGQHHRLVCLVRKESKEQEHVERPMKREGGISN